MRQSSGAGLTLAISRQQMINLAAGDGMPYILSSGILVPDRLALEYCGSTKASNVVMD